MNDKVKVKWIGGNTPVIIIHRNDSRLYPTKRELLELRKEIDEFINYYKDDFLYNKIDNHDEFGPENWADVVDYR